ncbi:poly-(ADP-ribose) polymerase [Rhynchophorus ferrugineus]|uniref:poly-(ADP-ribose) polymerase n=1 Tax=Rhynchophorus ferrugineus TaxID=354439 RepID=UPI003FCC548E
MDLPFRSEYSKSNRAKCKLCKESIAQGVLRLAVMVQSHHFDGKQPNWYHFKCFFKKQRVQTTDDIEHFESLRIEDQDKIKEHVGGASVIIPEKKGTKRSADKSEQRAKNIALKDYIIEYAKSGRSTCKGCQQKILKDEVRVSKKDYESDIGKQIGGADQWHHLTCFAQLRSELGYFEDANKIPGFKQLKKNDQEEARKAIPAIKQECVPEVKKIKKEEPDDLEKEYREQNKIMYNNRDKLKELKKPQLIELLEHNNQAVPEGVERILDSLSDIMTFGSLEPCSECKDGQLTFTKGGYICKGNVNEWVKCQTITKDPKRTKFKIPKHLTEEFSFLKKYKYKPRNRIIKDFNPTVAIKKEVKEEENGEPKVKRALPPLYEMEFVILGQPIRGKDVLKKEIQALGGKVVTKIKNTVMAVIANKDMVENMGSRIQEAESEQIQVVSEDFIDEAKNYTGKIPELIMQKSICNWGSDPTTRLPPEPSSSLKSGQKSRSRFTSSVPSKIKLKLKGGSAVDPDSGIENIAHVYEDRNKEKYTAVLGLTDIQSDRNSFYKLQLLKSDKGDRYWIFRSWGRIGTTIGNNKLEEQTTLKEAISKFEELYLEKSGNEWENHHQFVKVPGKMYPIDVDYGSEAAMNLDIVESDSKLPKPVQNLVKLVFDVKQMNKLLLEFELDTEKMPLGKLSKKQIQSAFDILSELQSMVDKENVAEHKLIEATNRFYTLIPHNFGIEKIPVLKDKDIIKQKLDMLDNLLEMEIAYSLMKSSGSEHTVDSYYKQLKTDIEVLDKKSEEFQIIKEYVKNTHAETHDTYDLDIEDVFLVKREGESKRYKPFKKLHNRKLLWHGSRITNYAGILSQGLRIAPPEAPVTGYMFGKGVYFADMVSKSANYCCTSPDNSTGLLLLCEVALGNMYERPHADHITKLPKGKHSCKGVGRTHPDPGVVKTIDGAEVPLGKGVANPGTEKNSLLYNEYIVYDVAQVQIKYLLKVNFKYKY